jgi:hypothetical protein
MSTSNFPPFIPRGAVPQEQILALGALSGPRRLARVPLANVNVRGTPFAPVEAFVRSQYQESGWRHFKSLLEPAAREVVAHPVIATNWYPFHVALSVVDGLVALAEGRSSVLRDFAVHNLDYATNVVFRAIFKMGSPQFMVARSDQVWKKYYSIGRMVCDVGPTRSRIELRDFPYLTPSYEKLLLHSIEAVLLKAGARLRRLATTRSALQGDTFTEFTHEWV